MTTGIDINKYYVGELHLSCDLETEKKFQVSKTNFFKTQRSNSPILVNNICEDHVSHYNTFFSIFLKLENDRFLCLHDGLVYEKTAANSFCKNMKQFANYLPKMGSRTIDELSIYDALFVFDILFKRNRYSITSFYNNTKYDLNQFNVAKLRVLDYVKPETDGKPLEYGNLGSKYMLDKYSKKIGEFSESYIFSFSEYQCLFVKTPNGILNLCDNQMYLGEDEINFYYDMIPLDEYIKTMQFTEKESLTISKALKLIKK